MILKRGVFNKMGRKQSELLGRIKTILWDLTLDESEKIYQLRNEIIVYEEKYYKIHTSER